MKSNEANITLAEEPRIATMATLSVQNDDLRKLHSICEKMSDNQGLNHGQPRSQTTDSILQLLVTEDMSSIKSPDVLKSLFNEYLHLLSPKIISEVLSVLIAIVKKSVFHLESARGLLIPCIDHLMAETTTKNLSNNSNNCVDVKSDTNISSSISSISLAKHFLREWVNLLIAHSCDVEELKSILKSSERDPSLLNFIQQANQRQRNRPPAFFAFPGTKGSMMSLPPFQKWPIQVGWSFSTWFFLEPKACAQPYLYNFKTGKSGLGYSAHFTGNCLVLTSIRVKGKGVQHCVAYEFPSYKWIHCAITYHNKWRASEIKVYINGQLSANIEMPWQVQTTEIFDKCFIGGSGSINSNDRSGELNCFCGQMSAIYLFNEGLSPAQICAIHRLSPSYMGQFKYSNESHVNLPPQICKVLYEEKLASSLFCLFTPVAVDSGTLCIQLAPFKSSTTVSAQNYFVSAPHAALAGQTKAIITQPICSTLQSLGCSYSLLPLLDVFANNDNSEACSSLIGFLCDLLENSPHWLANEIVQNNGFVVVACALTTNARLLLSEKLLNIFLNLTRTLLTTSSTVGDSLLLKHLTDNILINPTLWIYADAKLQIKLYSYLATEFLHGTSRSSNMYTITNSTTSSPFIPYNPTSSATMANQKYAHPSSTIGVQNSSDDTLKGGVYDNQTSIVSDLMFGEIRRVSTVLQSLHALKYYYWISEEKGFNQKACNQKLRPSLKDLATIRSHILLFTKELIVRANTTPVDELQGLLNYLSSCTCPENLLDVLDMLSSLLRELPNLMVSALDQKHGIRVLFTLIGSHSERVRVRALRMLGLFLAQCTHKKKHDIMGPNNLFMLLFDKLRVFKPLTLEVYRALMDIVLESDEQLDKLLGQEGSSGDLSKRRISNSLVIKVIATLLHEEAGTQALSIANENTETIDIKRIFLNDLWNLIVCSKENRRTILQMSVWQHWLINLIDSTISDSQLVRDQVLAIFRVLLYHAIRYEYGGWRVWIDTLAIVHTKVSYDEFCEQQDHDTSRLDLSRSELIEGSKIDTTKQESKSEVLRAESANYHEGMNKVDKNIDNGCDYPDKSGQDNQKGIVSSISERIPRESSGIQMYDDQELENEVDRKLSEIIEQIEDTESTLDPPNQDGSLDSVDLAPSRAYRKQSLGAEGLGSVGDSEPNLNPTELTRQSSLTSIHLDGTSNESVASPDNKSDIQVDPPTGLDNNELQEESNYQDDSCKVEAGAQQTDPQKATASPAFRIPEFNWGSILVKLLNDLMFSIECDLYNWRCLAKYTNLNTPPFIAKTVSSGTNQHGSTSNSNSSTSSATTKIDLLLQKPENQIYIINIVHFVSQLADNIIIAAGGLLPLLADATGGTRQSSTLSSTDDPSKAKISEGLTMSQANSLLYRLVNMVDIAIFAASHIKLSELEADKNTTSGGILRQCLRLACTVTVKNCLVVRSLSNRVASMGIEGGYNFSAGDFPKDMFDSYQGCSLLSANGLFDNSALSFENSDLIANAEYSPNQTPNTSCMPSMLPFQSMPIRDPNKLLQSIDISRIQASIYHDLSTESRQSQFLALSSLYFISVLMVSKYRDIIEPKQKIQSTKQINSNESRKNAENHSLDSGFQNGSSVSSIESNLLSFGRINPSSSVSQGGSTTSTSTLTDMLTTKLENTLDTICPLLKSIMCDFCAFLSKTLIGSHGQDLVIKEADRTFRRANTSPVELVMLLCSQEWQNTLQKNAGLAFIELINEGRVLSHGMKDHIVRVAMEAEFILSRLRADDVAKHEQFNIVCSETQAARLHEELLINSLISSASRRDYIVYSKFKETIQNERCRNYKLDIWEDDDRRKRRFVIDSWTNAQQIFYSQSSVKDNDDTEQNKSDTRRILDLQQTIELGGINEHCSPTNAILNQDIEESSLTNAVDKEVEECDEEDFEEEDDEAQQNDSNSHDSDQNIAKTTRISNNNSNEDHNDNKQSNKLSGYYSDKHKRSCDVNGETKNNGQLWDYDECSSVNDFTGSVIFAAECSLVWNIYAIPGVFQLTNHELHFEPNQNISDAIDALKKETKDYDNQGETEMCSLRSNKINLTDSLSSTDQINSLRKLDLKVLRYCDFLTCNGKILLADIRAIFSRHYLLQPHALEIFLAQRTSVMFAFSDFDTVKRAVKYLPPVGVGIKYGISQSRRASLMTPRQLFAASNMMQKWLKREISNFQYLTFLNTIAGRTYQDLNQYPVFPWILTNYESEELDLNLPSNFRDLSKPVGALNNKRRSEFIERYESWDNQKVPAFHYGTHYSTAAFTLNWLCRLRGSANSAYLALQDGRYEEDSRLFLSIGDSWVSSLVGGQQNVKELIPEFFYLPYMFHANLGMPEIEYPPWAKSAEQFVRMHRLALESELVSCQLHQWIDLIFGYKQRGPEAVNSVNTFYYLTYQGSVNLNMIQDPALREAVETQIKHFGQTPSQLTTEPHPPRFSALHSSPLIFSSSQDEINKVIKFPFNTSVLHISSCISNYIASTAAGEVGSSTGTSSNPSSAISPSSVLTITANNQYQIHKWAPSEQLSHPFVIDPQLEQTTSSSTNRRQLIDVDDMCSGISLKLNNYSVTQDISNEIQWPCAHYVVTLDGRYIIMGSFYDNSFRVFTTESGKLCQVIYGHRAPVTCIARSEGNATADFYIATGSQDCSLLLWTWNEKYAQVEGSGVSAVHNPLPKLTISGHQTPVLSVVICAELGLIISGSKNLILVNTTASGENLLNIDLHLPALIDKISFESSRMMNPAEGMIQRPYIEDREKTILEASMLGNGIRNLKLSKSDRSNSSRSSSRASNASERFAHLKDLCQSDYYVNNLQLARELAFIVCIALPPPRQKSKTSEEVNIKKSAALLMTFNLKGSLMECTTIGQAVTSPRLGDVCTLQVTRDGEHLILNDSPTSLKIYRTFDLQPIYAYNTNDIPNTVNEDHNRVRSLALFDQRYILVGLENGKIVIFNANFRNLQ